jgi:hypothetical protein
MRGIVARGLALGYGRVAALAVVLCDVIRNYAKQRATFQSRQSQAGEGKCRSTLVLVGRGGTGLRSPAVSRETMNWRRMGRLVVTVHTSEVPSDEDWGEYMAGVDAYLPLEDQRVLVVSAGGGPNGKQRKMMTDALNGARVPVAIVTNSLLMRGAGIAVSWFNPSLKVLRPEDLDRAINYLGLTEWERGESARVLKELEKGLGLDVIRLSKLPRHGA